MKFKEWFKYKLEVNRYPMPCEIKKTKFDYIVNVSDEYIPSCLIAAQNEGVKYFWLPMNECMGEMGLNSLYGALQILWIAEQENARVLLHCHAGANRSPTVRDAYYFLRTKSHLNPVIFDSEEERRLDEFVGGKRSNNNRLLDNIEQGHLPAIKKLESFIGLCETQFKKDDSMRGGGIDYCKHKAQL